MSDFKPGDIVRYGPGATALMRLTRETQYGWYGEHFYGGEAYQGRLLLGRTTEDDVLAWVREHSRPQRRRDALSCLTFKALRIANEQRIPLFKNSRGQPAHREPDGSDWSPAQWLQAVCGELGEYANLRKKFERGDIDAADFLPAAADELADVVTYLDILAAQLGIDLGKAVMEKFNRVSKRVGCDVRLTL